MLQRYEMFPKRTNNTLAEIWFSGKSLVNLWQRAGEERRKEEVLQEMCGRQLHESGGKPSRNDGGIVSEKL